MSRVWLRYGDNEIEVEGTDAFVKTYIEEFHSRISKERGDVVKPELKESIYKASSTEKPKQKAPTPAEYFKTKGSKADGISRVLIFGKYLEEFKAKSPFKQSDINDIAKEARLAKNIHAQYFTNAVQRGLLRAHGKGAYSLTLSADEYLSKI
ncbi:MAG: hypothetical protein WC891_02200 [Actinomycetota bacterium]